MKVQFLKIADRIGSGVLAFWIGWVMVCFTMMTLHTAPLGRKFLFGGFKPEERMFMGWRPTGNGWDSCRRCRGGAFCRSARPRSGRQEKYVFDPHAEFMPKYDTRRANSKRTWPRPAPFA